MPNWKKLIVSGSAGSLSSLTVDNNISANSISSSGAITGSDTYIDDWGSVSASLASISSSAISIPTLQQVTEQGSSTDQQINITGALTSSGLIYPTADGSDKEVLVTDGSGNLTFERPNVYANVKNKSGVTLLKGTPVHASSSVGNLAEVIAASASVASTMPATFVLNQDLADDAEGLAVVTGFLNGVDTSAFSEGDVVYVGADGGYTNVKPTGSSNLIQNLGIVINVDASNGSGFIYGSGRSNDIPNLPVGKVWVGSDEYSVTSSVVHLDETNGRLGIGTTTPQDTLHVEGNITGSGNIDINGTLTAAVKSFDIPHPTQEGKRLVYGVLEGPEHAVYVRGESKADTIILPEEWVGLVDETTITVQLTPIGSPDIYYYQGYEDNTVKVGGPQEKNYFYYIQATRKDVEPLTTVQ